MSNVNPDIMIPHLQKQIDELKIITDELKASVMQLNSRLAAFLATVTPEDSIPETLPETAEPEGVDMSPDVNSEANTKE